MEGKISPKLTPSSTLPVSNSLKIKPDFKTKKHFVLKILHILLIVVFSGTIILVAYQNSQLRKQFQPKLTPLHRSSIEISQENRKENANKKWQSPSEKKYITYKYSPDFDEYRLHLYDQGRESNIGRLNEPVADIEVTWSPDESHVVVSDDNDLTRIFCVNNDNKNCYGKVVFYTLGGGSAFWSDNQTAYLRYINMGNDVVSKLTFLSDAVYPKEQIIYKKPWNAFFAYRPVSISPNNIYLVMERRYEGPPVLAIMNVQTGKISEVRQNNESYVLSPAPNYSWNGNQLTFKGGLTKNGSWLELVNKETQEIDNLLLKEITIDASVVN